MGREKVKGHRSVCDECGNPLGDESVFHHKEMNYCQECMAEHIESEHSKGKQSTHPLATPEGRRAWTYKST